jgi:hypothetical protein
MESFLELSARLMNLPTPFKDLQQPSMEPNGYAHETVASPDTKNESETSIPRTADSIRTGLRALESALRLAIMVHANSGTREISNPKAPRPYLPAALNWQLRVVASVIKKEKENVTSSLQGTISLLDILTKILRPLIIYLCLVGNRACEIDRDLFRGVVALE